MPIKRKGLRPTKSKSLSRTDTGKPTRQILGDTGHEAESYSDIFAKLMDLKPKTPLCGYREVNPRNKR
jgi:hypothetical protein